MRRRDLPLVVDHQPLRSLPIATALRKKRNLWKQNSVYNRRVRSRILSHVKKSETRDCRGNCLLAPTLQNRVLYNEQSDLSGYHHSTREIKHCILLPPFLTYVHLFIHLLSNVVLSYHSLFLLWELPQFSILFLFSSSPFTLFLLCNIISNTLFTLFSFAFCFPFLHSFAS
jgi:hypothetical protein